MIYQETEKHVIPECRTPVQSKRNSSPLTSILSICRYTGVGMIVPLFSSRGKQIPGSISFTRKCLLSQSMLILHPQSAKTAKVRKALFGLERLKKDISSVIIKIKNFCF